MKNKQPFTLQLAKPGIDVISPKVDFVFKNLFGTEANVSLTASLLTGLIKRPQEDFESISFLDPTLEREYDDDKKGILDILLELKDGTNINIEMQVLEKIGFIKRILFYNSKLITRQAKKGQSYHSISKTITILLLNFELNNDTMFYKNRYTFYDKVTHSELTDLCEIITIELPKINNEEKDDLRFDTEKLMPWLEFINANNKEEIMIAVEKYPHLQEAYEKLKILSLDEERIVEYNKRLMWYYDEVAKIEKIEELETKSEKLQIQLYEANLTTAKNALSLNLAIDTIAKLTGLTTDEIEKLKQN